ncbi:hypothetical protein SADUNF_Sadunf16G0204300 [Salix dunnii]|uniref:Uncharacterized protein n=1 Tax=Salix dunnii TaxID=1413687 RepID=A0A835JB05_9ROSI|nr:hypothetical protein SADUNF_Sadunf16G0204300 [Salix dunnii]
MVSNCNVSTKKSKKLCWLPGLFSKTKEAVKPKLQDAGARWPHSSPPVIRPSNTQTSDKIYFRASLSAQSPRSKLGCDVRTELQCCDQ